MKLKKYANRLLVAVLAVAAVACVDESYRLDEVSTEVTLVEESTTLPLGNLKKKTIGDLLGDQEINGLVKDENGNYAFSVDGESQSITIDGITTSFEIPSTESSFEVEMPSLNFDNGVVDIKAYDEIDSNIAGLSDYIIEGELPSFLPEFPKFSGSYVKTFDYDDAHIHFDVPEQIDGIHKIYFKDVETGHYGAPIHITIDLKGFADINGGGKLKFQLTQNGGEFTLLNADNSLLCVSDSYEVEYAIESGAETIDFVVYVESITNHKALNPDHSFDLDLSMECKVDYEIQAKAGSFNTMQMPRMELSAKFEYGDAEVVLNNNIDLINFEDAEGFDININDMPEQVVSINGVELKEGTELTLFAHGLEWLAESGLAEDLVVEVTLPEFLVLHSIDGLDYEYDQSSHKITTSAAAIVKGLTIGFDGIDFGAEGLTPENGAITLHFSPVIKAHFDHEGDIKVSKLLPDAGKIEVSAGILGTTAELLSVSGRVNYSDTQTQTFELSGVEDLNIYIGGIGLSPVIFINIENPLTIDAVLSAAVSVPEDAERSLSIDAVVVKRAEYVNGEVVPTTTQLVLGKADRRAEYGDAQYTFVECDMERLLRGSIPNEIRMDLSFAAISDEVMTLYTSDIFTINYDYSLSMPLEPNEDLNIRYSDSVEVGDIFDVVSDYENISLRDIKVIMDVRTTIPLAFGAEVVLLDADENPSNVKAILREGHNAIVGSKDGVTESRSELIIELELGEDDSVASLKDVRNISFEVEAFGVAQDKVGLNENQYIEASLKLQVAGVSLDIKDFIDSDEE